MTDKDIVVGIVQKDEKIIRYFVDANKDMIYRTCLAYLQNENDAEDLTQEIFIKILESIRKFKGKSKLSTWIIRIAINHALNAIRSKKIKPVILPLDQSADPIQERIGVQAEEGFDHKQLQQALNEAIQSLPENQSKVFVLKKYHDLSYKEITAITGLSESAVESLLVRAKQGLQKKLQHFYRENYS